LNYEKGLAKELRSTIQDDLVIKDELKNIKKRIDDLQHQVDLLNKGYRPEDTISYKSFTTKEIAEMKKTMSWSKLASYLKCSVSTCQRLVREGRKI
jgi:hypothetical protein